MPPPSLPAEPGAEPTTVALIVAAGRGSRFGGDVPKQYRPLGGETVLRRTLRAFLDHPRIGAVRTIVHPDDIDRYHRATAGLALLDPVAGGASRQESAHRGLASLAGDAPDHVLIHDAARPMVAPALIRRVLDALADTPAVLPALPVVDTLKRGAEAGSGGGRVAGTVDRSGLWRAQTPQGFHFRSILAAHEDAVGRELTDDAAIAEAAGLPVALVAGDEDNIKITSEDDLNRVARMLRADYETRTGSGYDVHRFTAGDHLMLGGIALPHTAGLAGHSDADVVLHAITDAILGCIAAGDIGSHFPPSDPRWRGAASARFLAHAAGLVGDIGGVVRHIDVTIICERPKVGPYRDAMRASIAAILGIAASRVSVKATTTERLGFTGRGEGIAAHAVATIACPFAGDAGS